MDNQWTILGPSKKVGGGKKKRRYVSCKCSCGTIKDVVYQHITSGKSKSCGCIRDALSLQRIKELNNIKHPMGQGNRCGPGGRNNWKGSKNNLISGSYLCDIKCRSKKRGYEFDIDIDYIEELLIQQKFRCALSGISIQVEFVGKSCKDGIIASLDRIDSTKGYIRGNVQWVHKDINWMKQEFAQERFIELCKAVANNNELQI